MMAESDAQSNELAKPESELEVVGDGQRRDHFRLYYSKYATVSHDFDWLHVTTLSEVDKYRLKELGYDA